ncbi:MAG: hypothetical protein ACYTFI_03830 [Planctomycetota bacterium]|jgi:hypothetical protein
MHCKRCKIKMRLSPTVHHKKRKWICPRCGRARMETVRAKGGRAHAHRHTRRTKGDEKGRPE